jgi:hypothetical protein
LFLADFLCSFSLLPLLSVGVGGGVLVCCVVVLLSSAEIVLLCIVSLCLLLLQPRFEFRKKSFHLFSRAAREKKRFYVVVVEEARDDDFPRAVLTRTTPPRCEKKPNEKQRRFSRNAVKRECVCCLARRQRDLSGERCVPNERHARNNNNTKQIPEKIPTAGKNV